MDFIREFALPSGAESYLGFYVTLGLFIAMLLLMNFIFALTSETYQWAKSKYKGEAYTFHFQNPVTAIKNRATRIKNWFNTTIQHIKIVVQAVKDIRWLIAQNIEKDLKTKYAFMAYSALVFFYGAVILDLFNFILKNDLFKIVTNLLKAI